MKEDTLPEIASALSLDLKKLWDAISKKHVQEVRWKYPSIRFRDNIGHVERGTVVFDGGYYFRGYPKLRRLLVLGAGLKKHFKGEFVVEEKLDGYNIRIALVNGELVAVTRGGLACPYTSQKISELIELDFFEQNPKLMLCSEVIGLQNPYQEKSYPEAGEFGYFVFDVRDRISGKPLSILKKAQILKKYKLPAVRSFGKFTNRDARKLLKLVRGLGDKNREGVVIKSAEMEKIAKYTANKSTNKDLQYAFKFPFDYGQAFMFRRIVREAFQACELGLSGKELEKEAAELGRSILVPLAQTIKSVADGKEVTEDFDLVVPNVPFGEEFIEHLKHFGVHASIEKIEKRKDGILLKIHRHYQSTNDKIKAYLKGEFCGE